MFSRHYGTEPVKCGMYLSIASGEFVNIESEGGRLPGDEHLRYIKISPVLALLIGPLAGLLFVIFLPLAVPLLLAWLVVTKIRAVAPRVAAQVAGSLQQGQAVAIVEGITPQQAAGEQGKNISREKGYRGDDRSEES